MTLEGAALLAEGSTGKSQDGDGKNQIRRGLEIFEKYTDSVSYDFVHEMILVEFDEGITSDDVLMLGRLDWKVNIGYYNCWIHY